MMLATKPASSKEVDNFVFDIMDMLGSPIITYSASWKDSIPMRLIDAIKLSRMTAKMQGSELATYPEVCAYIMTAIMEFPMHGEWVDIYLHVSCTVCEEYWNENHWEDVQARRQLTDYENKYILLPLRRWLYEKRRKITKERMKNDSQN
jgi:hypothetical protein